ncbi:hypothetical protein F7725_013478 [Dissostichus mawsoni]|uniref:Uncharacterized protein n=1 Tax=Dissostichus mawsoni TaxID=36200 RepID=A0A7J5YQB8_DISMA|nr:hypothetical protein F7725_013478 [Dissostichus mawsoni]
MENVAFIPPLGVLLCVPKLQNGRDAEQCTAEDEESGKKKGPHHKISSSDSRDQEKKVSAPPQHCLLSVGQTLAETPEARDEQQTPRPAHTGTIRGSLSLSGRGYRGSTPKRNTSPPNINGSTSMGSFGMELVGPVQSSSWLSHVFSRLCMQSAAVM